MSKVSIVMYHYVRDLENSRYPGIKGLDYELFKQQILWMKENYNIIRMEELIAAYDNGYVLPDNPLLLTFDDGYTDHYSNVFPFLYNEGLQGSFFVTGRTFCDLKLLDVNKIHFILASTGTGRLVKDVFEQMNFYRGKEFDIPDNDELYQKYAVPNRFDNKDVIFAKRMLQTALPERLRKIITTNLFERYIGIPEERFARELYMSKEQIKVMKNCGMFMGIHGYDHYWLGDLDEDEMKKDIRKGLETMEEFVDIHNWVMNYPYGSYNDKVIDYISGIGCKLGITVNAGLADTETSRRYELPRFDTNDYLPKSSNYKNYT